jgi:hypothetical protein
MSVRKGEPWGEPAAGPPDLDVTGSDRDLARAVASVPGALVRFRPDADSDLARTVGLRREPHTVATAVALDALAFDAETIAVNMVVLGTPPDRLRRFARSVRLRVVVDGVERVDGPATTVVVATGQFLRACDLVPRGHPGDGRAEVQVYRLRAGERRAMRHRLPGGAHVPHPRILQRSGRRIEIEAASALPLEADGEHLAAVSRLTVEVRPGAYRLLV